MNLELFISHSDDIQDPYDKSNSKVMFFKMNTDPNNHDQVERRHLQASFYANETVAMYYDNRTLARLSPASPSSLNVRGTPKDPGCPRGGPSLPDTLGRIFHPNEHGHEVMAAYVLEAAANARDKINGQPLSCPVTDSMTCYSSQGSKAYASAQALNNNIDDFCSYVGENVPDREAGWGQSKTHVLFLPIPKKKNPPKVEIRLTLKTDTTPARQQNTPC